MREFCFRNYLSHEHSAIGLPQPGHLSIEFMINAKVLVSITEEHQN